MSDSDPLAVELTQKLICWNSPWLLFWAFQQKYQLLYKGLGVFGVDSVTTAVAACCVISELGDVSSLPVVLEPCSLAGLGALPVPQCRLLCPREGELGLGWWVVSNLQKTLLEPFKHSVIVFSGEILSVVFGTCSEVFLETVGLKKLYLCFSSRSDVCHWLYLSKPQSEKMS